MTLIVRPGFAYDTDASNYIDAVEAADQADTPGIGVMETGVRYAINDFVIGCKNDGVWTAIKNSCILAGAKTLEGSFIDIKSCTKVLTNNNFADGTYSGSNYTTGDYNRETGLKGDASTKYLNSNRAGNADPQNNFHCSVFASQATIQNPAAYIGHNGFATGVSGFTIDGTTLAIAIRSGNGSSGGFFQATNQSSATGFIGGSRTSSSTFNYRFTQATSVANLVSTVPDASNFLIFQRGTVATPSILTNARLAFYSIGESLDLAALDNRVSILIAQFAAVIP
jgi:hypothetical protein